MISYCHLQSLFSGGNFGQESDYKQLAIERRRFISDLFDLAYFTRVMSYKEARMLTPLERDVITQRFANIMEEREKEMKKAG